VERNKEGDGFVGFRWGEIKKQEADGGGARLMIETGAEFPIGPWPRQLPQSPWPESRRLDAPERNLIDLPWLGLLDCL
jgi:hypothetical protein